MSTRPEQDIYYLALAVSVAARAECTGHKVGAVIVRSSRVLSTGYNGTPEGWGNCQEDKTCVRCENSAAFGGSGNGYDKCVCVHAEANAITSAARYGTSLDGATAYVTHQPCISCAKELLQAGITRVFYIKELLAPAAPDEAADRKLKTMYERLMRHLRAEPVNAERVRQAYSAAIDHVRIFEQVSGEPTTQAVTKNGQAPSAQGNGKAGVPLV